MRTYKVFDAFDFLVENFSFLSEDWDFEETRAEKLNYGTYLEFTKNNLKLYLGYDYKDNFFYFCFVVDGEKFSFLSFFETQEPNIDLRIFEPDDFQYKASLMRNVEYLKKYKKEIFDMLR